MARVLGRIALIAVLLLPGIRPAVAWAPATRIGLVDEAVRMMPASLRLVLERHRAPLLRGVLTPLKSEDDPGHLPPWDEGSLDRSVQAEVSALLGALERADNFDEIAERFGRVAHYVADAGFPPGASGAGGAARYAHFSSFCDGRREKFPVVFYGHAAEPLERQDFRGYTLIVLGRAREDDARLAFAYAKAGDPPRPAFFDDRSVPFAVGSLAYSRTFTDIVRVWLAAWDRAGGDMGQTPYMKPKH
jgi:hypothetical protein